LLQGTAKRAGSSIGNKPRGDQGLISTQYGCPTFATPREREVLIRGGTKVDFVVPIKKTDNPGTSKKGKRIWGNMDKLRAGFEKTVGAGPPFF